MGQYWFSFLFLIIADNLIIDEAESVSPPSTPLSVGIRLISASENENLNENSQSSSKRAKKSVENDDFNGGLLTGSVLDGYRFIEKFNRDMMDQFLDYQRRVAASQIRWEQERYRQEQLAIGIRKRFLKLLLKIELQNVTTYDYWVIKCVTSVCEQKYDRRLWQ